jgi:predicted negative regulator of RcsB-dependent stress response
MTGQKQIEQSLKKPDSFQGQILNGINLLVEQRKRIFMFLTPLLVVGLVVYGAWLWMNHQAEARRSDLAKILAMQSDEIQDVGKRREDIQKQIDGIRDSVKPDAKGKRPDLSPAQLADITNLEKKMTDLKPDHMKSTEAFKKFYDSNKEKPEGWMAGLSWAAKQLQDGKATEARPIVEAISKISGSNKFYQLTSRFMLIGILEDAGDYDAAIKECDALVSLVTDEAKPSVLLTKGRLHYFKKSNAEAKTVLNELIDKHGSSPEASKARGIIALMGQS